MPTVAAAQHQLLAAAVLTWATGGLDTGNSKAWADQFKALASAGHVSLDDAYSLRTTDRPTAYLRSMTSKYFDPVRWEQLTESIYEQWNKSLSVKAQVVAVMTTTPKRIQGIRPAVESVLTQTYSPDRFYVFVPYVFLRENTTYKIPEWLRKYHDDGMLEIRRCEDWGPGTALYAALHLDLEPSTYIFKIDDDQFYGPHALRMLLRAAEDLPGRAFTLVTTQCYPHTSGVILQGVHGLLLQRKFFDSSILDFSPAGASSAFCKLNNDLWFTLHLAKRGIRRETLQNRGGSRVLSSAYESDALFQGGAGTDNYLNFYLCNSAILRRYPDIWKERPRTVVLLRSSLQDLARLTLGVEHLGQHVAHIDQVYICGLEGSADILHGDWRHRPQPS